MEQRNYTNQNDIKPIEDLISGSKTPPEIYPSFNPQKQPPPQKQVRKSAPPEREQKPKSDLPRFRPGAGLRSTEARPGLFADDHMRAQRIKDKITPDKKERKKLNLRKLAPLAWGTLGFLFGIAFWHSVGFWNFVEDAVLQKPEPTRLSRSVLQKQQTVVNTPRAIMPATPVAVRRTITPLNTRSCINLIMDRRTGKTASSNCRPGITFYQGRSPVRTTAFRQ